jgi:hypothetical protein
LISADWKKPNKPGSAGKFNGSGGRLSVLLLAVAGFVLTSADMKRSVFRRYGLTIFGLSGVLLFRSNAAHAGDRVHDGLYLRLGAGLGYASDAIKTDPVTILGISAHTEGTATGFAGASELAVGWSLSDGFVLGGGLYSAWIFSPKASGAHVTVPPVQVTGDINFDASSFHIFGPFVDYYFDARSGVHLQGGLGYAWLSLGDANVQAANVASVRAASTGGGGFGLMAGIGDEWWVSDAFSIGLLGRLTAGFMSGTDANGITWNHTAFAPALLFVATMN